MLTSYFVSYAKTLRPWEFAVAALFILGVAAGILIAKFRRAAERRGIAQQARQAAARKAGLEKPEPAEKETVYATTQNREEWEKNKYKDPWEIDRR